MDGFKLNQCCQMNPYAVKQNKETEGNSQLKDGRKDFKRISNLVKDGNYRIPYLPEKIYSNIEKARYVQETRL